VRSASRLRDARQVWLLLAGLLVLGLTAAAGRTDVLGRFLEPPIWAAVPLAIAASLIGLVLVARSTGMLRSAGGDPRGLIRGVRLLFLAVAAFAAAAGWLLGSAMPVVVGLVIAAVDVIETTALLLITPPTESAAGQEPGRGGSIAALPAIPAPPTVPARPAPPAPPAVPAPPAIGSVPAMGEGRTPNDPGSPIRSP
jgi:hypothetical protein